MARTADNFAVVASSPESENAIRRLVSEQNDEWARLMDRFAHLKKTYAQKFTSKPELRDEVLYGLEDLRRQLVAKWKAARTGEERADVLRRGWNAANAFDRTLGAGLLIGGVIKWGAIVGGGALLLYLLTRKTDKEKP